MDQEKWTAVDRYLSDLFTPGDPALEAALQASAEAELPGIQITPNFGKLLFILAQTVNARAILEIGTLGGYSAIWLARALPPSGYLITLEANPEHARVARQNLARAGLAEMAEVRLGPALVTMEKLFAEGRRFDLVFIDADKPSYQAYLEWALMLTHPGSLIIADNVVRRGNILNESSPDAYIQGMRCFNAALAAEPRLSAVELQTVSSKGYDGFAIARVTHN